MLQRVVFRLVGRYRVVAFLPSAARRLEHEALLRRQAAIPLCTQFRHRDAVSAVAFAGPSPET
jgi:hypothetical protein